MAIAFVIRHQAVTAAIIGPRTMEHLESQLGAADVVLTDEVLDRIDEIVRPGRQSTRPTPAGTTRRSSRRRAGVPLDRTPSPRGGFRQAHGPSRGHRHAGGRLASRRRPRARADRAEDTQAGGHLRPRPRRLQDRRLDRAPRRDPQGRVRPPPAPAARSAHRPHHRPLRGLDDNAAQAPPGPPGGALRRARLRRRRERGHAERPDVRPAVRAQPGRRPRHRCPLRVERAHELLEGRRDGHRRRRQPPRPRVEPLAQHQGDAG